MCRGSLKWRESTTTSPSGKHLSIYQALIKTMYSQSDPTSDSLSQTAYECLLILHKLMVLAIQHCHTYKRWTTVHNFLLEKTPGFPLLNKLRVIHIYEADWSLIQKYFVSYKINKSATINPGRSAIEMGITKVLTCETIRNMRLNGGVVYNDAKACYNRIIENLSNIELLHHGLPKPIAALHAQTFKLIKYRIKHKLALSDSTHQHNHPAPVFEVGQGACDAPASWVFVCDAIIHVYKKLGTDATIISATSNIIINLKISAFVDDTALLSYVQQHLSHCIQTFLQNDAQLWENLLHTSGGKLEIPKCNFSVFQWEYDKFGRAFLTNDNISLLSVTSSDDNTITKIPFIPINQSYKYVGIHITLDGNMHQQIQDLQSKCNKMATLFNNT
jgi:hypothetical protein